jgi:hypothetical protein
VGEIEELRLLLWLPESDANCDAVAETLNVENMEDDCVDVRVGVWLRVTEEELLGRWVPVDDGVDT